MPRVKTRTTEKASWNLKSMEMAMTAVKNNRLGVREASRYYNVPYSSLRDRLRLGVCKVPRMGRKTTLSAENEKEFAMQVLKLSKLFFGVTTLGLRRAVFQFATENGIPNNFNKELKLAGKDWLYGFLRRHPEISLRKPESTSIYRITAFNKVEVERFFGLLEQLMTRFNFPPERTFNMDETGITTVHKPSRIFAQKGQKQVGAATSWERGKTVTVCCCISAAGGYIPPMLIYPRKRMAPALGKNGIPGSILQCSQSGWINEELFLIWLQHFVKHTASSIENPTLLILDNHESHSNLQSFQYCRQNGVHLLSIPPHTSHRLQPLDLTFFGPLKKSYDRECDMFMKTHNYEKISHYDVADLLRRSYVRVATIEKAIKGFQSAGIMPLNPSVFDEDDFLPADLLTPNPNSVYNAAQTVEVPQHRTPSPKNIVDPTENSRIPGHRTSPLIDQQRTTSPISEFSSEDELPLKQLMDSHQLNKYSPCLNVSVQNILPLPTNISAKKSARKNREKKHAEILTSTPMKTVLEENEKKRQEKRRRTEAIENAKRGGGKIKAELKVKEKLKKKNSISLTVGDPEKDLCSVCGEFGKDNELWFQCCICQLWAHADCTDQQSGSIGYKCDNCRYL